ncbi:UDP-glucose 4-epimerase [Thalassoglobus neptunius]|uniref:UDP-glucose 4-epimerase n=1 Tax=Thalassoglobus neptunius TaxID=1938619 RepID=A0A5C5X486_9PLAN|nr:SDR family oxidoreductase [Thalassoglobus neptunius]TWT56952.1 UDP-glucose 4-epimerase [Thalassoglobus neptunius]
MTENIATPICLVTGGAGFIGSHLVARLVENGCQVRVLDNLSTGKLGNIQPVSEDIELFEGSLLDRQLLDKSLQDVRYVFHEAALPSVPVSLKDPLATHEVCATGTLNLLDASRQAGVQRLIYAGSSSAYGESEALPHREDAPTAALSPYAAAKLAGELYCQAFTASYGFETVRLRYFNVFGPRQDPGSPYSAVIPLFITAILNGKRPTIFGDGSQTRDFVYVEDVVNANIAAMNAPSHVAGGVYNVASGESISVRELATKISHLMDAVDDPQFEAARSGEIQHSWAETASAREALGFVAEHSFDDALRKTVEAFIQHFVQQGSSTETPSS